jgi:hypothetical protein
LQIVPDGGYLKVSAGDTSSTGWTVGGNSVDPILHSYTALNVNGIDNLYVGTSTRPSTPSTSPLAPPLVRSC